MATTLGDLIEDVEGLLHGHTGQDEQVTYLNGAISSSATSLVLGSIEGLRRGVIEIDDELLWVDSVDAVSKTVTIAPFGRGYRSTTAASHSNNTKVTMNPLLPRNRVRRAINETIEAVGGDLFGVANGTISYESGTVTYELSTATFPDLLDVLAVTYDSETSTDSWITVRRWKFIDKANVTVFPSGKSIDLYDPIRSGSDINVTYTKNTVAFSDDITQVQIDWLRKNYPEYDNLPDDYLIGYHVDLVPVGYSIYSQDFTEATNLPSSAKDVITYGAAARLAWAIEGSRTNQTGVSANVLGDQYGTNWRGAANNFGKQLYAFHQQRLQEERDALLRTTQPTIHYLR